MKEERQIRIPQFCADAFEEWNEVAHQRHEMNLKACERAVKIKEGMRGAIAGTGVGLIFWGTMLIEGGAMLPGVIVEAGGLFCLLMTSLILK